MKQKTGSFEKKFKVTVNKIKVKDIKLQKEEFTANENEAVDLPYTYTPSNSTNAKFIWESSNPEILRVWGNRFRGLKPGTAYVIVKTEDRKF